MLECSTHSLHLCRVCCEIYFLILSVVAVSSVGTQNGSEKKQRFLDGYFYMVERLQPTQIIFYGRVPDECKGNIVHIKQFSDKWNEAEVAQW